MLLLNKPHIMFFKKTEVLSNVKIYQTSTPNIEIATDKWKPTDGELIVFGLLLYARVLRLLRFKNKLLATEVPELFKEYFQGWPQHQNDEKFREMIYEQISILLSLFTDNSTLECKFKKMNNKYLLSVGYVKTKELKGLVYSVFCYTYNMIKPENKKYLIEMYMALSVYSLQKGGIGMFAAVNFPNEILSKYKHKLI